MSKIINTPAVIEVVSTFGLDPINTELEARGLAAQKDPTVGATILAMGVRSLDEFAATVVNLSLGTVESEDLRNHMAKAFPNHKIGDRHGSHYLSLARKGNLQGAVECRFQPAKATRKRRAKGTVGIDMKSMNAVQREALAIALDASNPELAAQVRAFVEPEAPKVEAPKAPAKKKPARK